MKFITIDKQIAWLKSSAEAVLHRFTGQSSSDLSNDPKPQCQKFFLILKYSCLINPED